MEQDPWYIHLGIYRIFAIGALLGITVVALLAIFLHWQPTLLACLAITLGSGITSAAAVLAWICITPPPPLKEHGYPTPVPLGKFLDDPDAVIAPNLHPDACDRLAEWLQKFAAYHGEESVWVLPLPDGPAADRVILAVPALSSGEHAALKRFNIESIEELSEDTRSIVFPHVERSMKLVELAWD